MQSYTWKWTCLISHTHTDAHTHINACTHTCSYEQTGHFPCTAEKNIHQWGDLKRSGLIQTTGKEVLKIPFPTAETAGCKEERGTARKPATGQRTMRHTEFIVSTPDSFFSFGPTTSVNTAIHLMAYHVRIV